MSFINTKYIYYIVPILLLVSIVFIIFEKKFYSWINDYWSLKRSKVSIISSVLLITSLGVLLLATLDLRGPEERINSQIPDQRTIILIDSSASMLVEDVRPNRFSRGVTLARHFVKKSAGHQISVILFSDTHKRVVPFTDDLDLLDARLAGLEKMNLRRGGSNITQAIQESVGYFKRETKANEKVVGNILLITDSEENDSNFNLKVPDSVNLGVLAIGTNSGGKIPMRTNSGIFTGYKKFKGKEVVSRLVEENIRKIGVGVKNFKYWIVLSYSLPTEAVLNFFRTSFKNNLSEGSVVTRPVLSYYLTIPAILLYLIATLLTRFKSFVLILLCIGLPQINQLKASENIEEKFKKGEATSFEKASFGSELMKNKDFSKARSIYRDIVEKEQNTEDDVLFNYATSLLYSGEEQKGLDIYSNLIKNSSNDELKQKVQSNVMNYFNQKRKNQNKDKKGKDQKKSDNKESDSKNSKDQNQEQQKKDKSKKGKENEESKDQNKKNDQNEKNKDKNKDKKEKNENKDKGKDKNKDKKEQKKSQQRKSLEQKENEIRKKRKLTKIPALLKQLMQDDRSLQQKYIDTATEEGGGKSDKKDW